MDVVDAVSHWNSGVEYSRMPHKLDKYCHQSLSAAVNFQGSKRVVPTRKINQQCSKCFTRVLDWSPQCLNMQQLN